MLLRSDEKSLPVKAMLDTGNRGPNFVSYELIVQLQRQREILRHQKSNHGPILLDASGNKVRSIGVIRLDFHFHHAEDPHRYQKWNHREEFNILPSDHIQVNFGAPYIERTGLLKLDDGALTPLTADRKLNSCMCVLFLFLRVVIGTVQLTVYL
jgi:hypothetical protein